MSIDATDVSPTGEELSDEDIDRLVTALADEGLFDDDERDDQDTDGLGDEPDEEAELREAAFDPNQPREPKGSPEGGQWTEAGGGAAAGAPAPVPGVSEPPAGTIEQAPEGSWRAKPSSAYPVMRPAGLDTKERFSDGHGHYTPERQALHEEIMAKFLEGTQPVQHPTATIIGGGMGCGKSTLVKGEGLIGPNTVNINVDDIRRELPELKEATAALDKASAGVSIALTHEEASDISRELIRRAADGRRNLVLDGTGDTTLQKLGGKIAEMRARGMSIVAEYVTTSVEIAQQRADRRARTTDRRFVNPDAMRAVHAAVSQIFPEAIRQGLFDRGRLWDVSLDFKPRLVATSVGKKLTIHNDGLWRDFLDKGK